MKFGLTSKTIESILSVLAKHSCIEKAIIYGSRAMGNHRNGSDIDLTLLGENIPISALLEIENQIDDLLLPYKIDLSIYHHISNAELQNHIERVGKSFYQKN